MMKGSLVLFRAGAGLPGQKQPSTSATTWFQLFLLRAFQFHARIVSPVNITMESLSPGAQSAGHSSGRNTMNVRISTALLVLTGLLCQFPFLRAEDKKAPAPAKVYGEWHIRPRPDKGTEYRQL